MHSMYIRVNRCHQCPFIHLHADTHLRSHSSRRITHSSLHISESIHSPLRPHISPEDAVLTARTEEGVRGHGLTGACALFVLCILCMLYIFCMLCILCVLCVLCVWGEWVCVCHRRAGERPHGGGRGEGHTRGWAVGMWT